MKFIFESIQDESLIAGSYLMDFGDAKGSEEETAIMEGKLLSVFGKPVLQSENMENSFNYVIRATAENGRETILCVYHVGMIHIGSEQKDEFTLEAARRLVEYVTAATPADYARTVYYLDFNVQMDISVKNGVAHIDHSEITDEKADELFSQWYT